ncbi:hypothetical protein JW872_00985 [Candidatus Babeliales bacterium]|nr:hypothetical protein [Candidatus Babeliales bacterium]
MRSVLLIVLLSPYFVLAMDEFSFQPIPTRSDQLVLWHNTLRGNDQWGSLSEIERQVIQEMVDFAERTGTMDLVQYERAIRRKYPSELPEEYARSIESYAVRIPIFEAALAKLGYVMLGDSGNLSEKPARSASLDYRGSGAEGWCAPKRKTPSNKPKIR